ncbi:PKD domain-containing protein [Candidatus Woesearchaeota archaeon]|nr:PKD domain-containing protein [Candidatus Woesearchaeota archaeon]
MLVYLQQQICTQKTTQTLCNQDTRCTWSTADNICETKTTTTEAIKGDFNNDNCVTQEDADALRAKLGSSDSTYDLNGDGRVDADDFFLQSDFFGKCSTYQSASQASFTVSAESIAIGNAVNFDATTSADQDGSIVQYSWNFGDGTTQDLTTATTSHTYNNVGTFEVTLTVKDDDNLESFAKRTITVAANVVSVLNPLNVNFNVNQNALINEELEFVATATDPDTVGSISAIYSWSFGDGTNSNGNTVNTVRRSYSIAGAYEVTLTATANGKTGTVKKSIDIVSPASLVELRIPTDLSTIYDVETNSIRLQWKDRGNYVTDSPVVTGGNRQVNYRISREFESVTNEEFAFVTSEAVCSNQICTFVDGVDIREGKEYIYKVRAEKGELVGRFSDTLSITIAPACAAVGGAGCTDVVTSGESAFSRGNAFCSNTRSGSTCVTCATGYSWDVASTSCLLNNPKANGESCSAGNECASRICSTANVCSAVPDSYDLNDDRCVDALDVDVLQGVVNDPSTANLNIHDLNKDGVVTVNDILVLSDNGGTGDACPIVKGDFNNNRCIDNTDKALLEEELNKPESGRRNIFDANADGGVNSNDLLYLRQHFREGGKCAQIQPLTGDINGDRCVDVRDISEFTTVMRATGVGGVVALNDLNGDRVLDSSDLTIIRNAFGGDNCPDDVHTYGDFNGDGRIEITVEEGSQSLSGVDGVLFTQHVGTTTSSANWDALYDLNGDGRVDLDDFYVLSDLFGVVEERTNFNSQTGNRISLVDSKIRLTFNSRENINTDVIAKYLVSNPKGSSVRGKLGLNFIDVTSTQPLTGKIDQVIINIVYNDEDVQRLGLLEDGLRMYYFNEETSDWELLPGSVDTVNNLVSGTTSHLSVYGLFGDNSFTAPADDGGSTTTPPSSTSSGGDSGSGGRRGSSGSSGGVGCNTLLVQNSENGDCKRICEYTIPFWQSKGYNTVSQCSDTVPSLPSAGQIPNVEDYVDSGVDLSNVDRDQDGLIDDLEIQYFGSLSQGFEDDFDGDGVANGRELADGTDPTNSSDFKIGGSLGNVLLVIFVLVLIGAAGSILWLRKQGKIGGNSSSDKFSRGMDLTRQEKKIVRYIEDARSTGMNTAQIRKNLVQAGWTKDQIDNAFSSFR